MQNQYINDIIQIPELTDFQILNIESNVVHIEATPIDEKQSCPYCRSAQGVIRKGTNGMRMVRHLSVFGKKSYLHVPSIRMMCNACDAGFVWVYEFVGVKQRYSRLLCSEIVEEAIGSTAAHSSRMQQTPASTVQYMHNAELPKICEQLTNQAWKEATEANDLVLGIDDFAIKKGHSYNTGIHNLKGETMLDLMQGRKLVDLRAYAIEHPAFLLLNPKAVVMDLARGYHTWISECFPNTIRIADRFHVHGYVIEAVQEVRKSIQQSLSPRAKAFLKVNHHLLNPPVESMEEQMQKRLETLLNYSPLLREVWEWKEIFTTWYNCSPCYEVAKLTFVRWCRQGELIDHRAVQSALRTMKNWQDEIVNYHQCRWTNATVEGRHNRIKAYQRRHYFMRNRSRYKAGILVECNRLRMLG